MTIDHCLATYGTLAPGRANHHEVAMLRGEWVRGTVRGWRVMAGWGSALGYPALVADPAGDPVEVWMLTSTDLPAHWARLDAFEGEGYRREPILVELDGAVAEAWIYVEAGAAD